MENIDIEKQTEMKFGFHVYKSVPAARDKLAALQGEWGASSALQVSFSQLFCSAGWCPTPPS